jgi:hypothetical protein
MQETKLKIKKFENEVILMASIAKSEILKLKKTDRFFYIWFFSM